MIILILSTQVMKNNKSSIMDPPVESCTEESTLYLRQ